MIKVLCSVLILVYKGQSPALFQQHQLPRLDEIVYSEIEDRQILLAQLI